MKSTRQILLLIAAALVPGLLHAQSQIPNRISYQGIVSDGVGLVGAGGPVNREVHFRIYDAANGGNLVYSETQTVTIANGEFSVLIGAGSDIPGEDATGPGGTTDKKIADGFNGSERFLGVTIDAAGDGIGNDAGISPRQQIVTSAFAFRAREAETIIDNAIGTGALASGSVTLAKMATGSVDGNTIVDSSITTLELNNAAVTTDKLAGNAVTSAVIADGTIVAADLANNAVTSAVIADGTIVAADLANNAVTSAKIADGSIVAADLANGSVTKAKLGGDVGIWGRTNQAGGFYTVYMDTPGADRVGINTTAAAAPLHVNNGFYQFNNYTRLLRNDGLLTDGGYYQTISIIASGFVKAEAFAVASDARIKKVLGRSDGAKDLELLGKIEVTDYKAIDQLARGARQHKKVIAQQVEAVFPQAVSRSTDVVPDLLKEARCEGGWVKLATDLKPGERVRMLAEGADEVFEVLEVKEGRFRVAWKGGDAPVFVYGREVDDFRMVDYDALAMLNLSATQEIHRQLEAERAKNSALQERLAALEAREKEREATFAKLEKFLESAPETVSVRTVLKESR